MSGMWPFNLASQISFETEPTNWCGDGIMCAELSPQLSPSADSWLVSLPHRNEQGCAGPQVNSGPVAGSIGML